MAQTTELPKRADVPRESTWNAEALFKDWGTWQRELENTRSALPKLCTYSGKLNENAETLADWLDLYQSEVGRLVRLQVYVSMSLAVDTNNSKAKAARGQLSAYLGEFSAAVAFADPEIQAIGEKLYTWAEIPRLMPYRHFFENLLRKMPHTRSHEVEEVLGMLEDTFNNIYSTASELTNSDLKIADAINSRGEHHPVMQATITRYLESKDRELRRTAWESYCDAYLSMHNTLASNYLTHIKASVFQARVRGYQSVLESRLKPFNLPVEVFYNLIETFQANLPVWHDYWETKRALLGVDTLHPYDVWAPIVDTEPSVDYQQAVAWICESLQPLGEDYVRVIRRGCLEERWVDYAVNEGKRQGAFSTRSFDSYPYIFMTYNGSLTSMSVLAHELGHSMHSYLAAQRQPAVYRDYTMMSSSVTETASNFHQAMTRAYLMETKANDPTFQIAIIDEAIANFHRYFFQMPILARFELEVFTRAEAGQPLNADILNGIMADFFAEGYGGTMTDDPVRTAITWAKFPHLYAPFYTFQYAVGISASHALADQVRTSKDAAQKYLNFLGAGASLYPMDLYRLAGVDMATPAPVQEAFDVLAGMTARLKQLAGI